VARTSIAAQIGLTGVVQVAILALLAIDAACLRIGTAAEILVEAGSRIVFVVVAAAVGGAGLTTLTRVVQIAASSAESLIKAHVIVTTFAHTSAIV